MKKFKQYITEVQRYQSGGRHTLYPYVMPPSGLFPPSINPNNPMMTPGWATNPYWTPAGTDEGDWSFGFPWLDEYSNTTWGELPAWLRILWGIRYGIEAAPGVDIILDIYGLFQLFRQWAEVKGLSPEEYEQYVEYLLQYLRDHNIPVPEFTPSLMREMFYMRMPDGTYQLFRWNQQTGQYEPVGNPIQKLPTGENVPPVYSHPDAKPDLWRLPMTEPGYNPPIPTIPPPVPNRPWSPTQSTYQWDGNNENPMISGMGG